MVCHTDFTSSKIIVERTKSTGKIQRKGTASRPAVHTALCGLSEIEGPSNFLELYIGLGSRSLSTLRELLESTRI